MPSSKLWAELTTTDLDRADLVSHVAVLPVAAIEQQRAAPTARHRHLHHAGLPRPRAREPTRRRAGALSADPELRRLARAHRLPRHACRCPRAPPSPPGASLPPGWRATGCRRLVVVNSHGGNSPVIDILAQELRAALGLLVVKASWQRFGCPRRPVRGGRARARHPRRRGRDLADAGVPPRPRAEGRAPRRRARFRRDRVRASRNCDTGRPTGFGWMAQDLHASGVAGDATAASAEAGEACAAHGAAAFIELLRGCRRLRSRRPRPALRRQALPSPNGPLRVGHRRPGGLRQKPR